MNFVLWLVKRAWKPVAREWNGEGAIIVRGLTLVLSGVLSLVVDTARGLAMGKSGDDPLPAGMIIVWFFVWCTIGAYYLKQYLHVSHAQYRIEQPEQEKSKRKRNGQVIDETEYFTPDWEAEINKINRGYAEEMMDTQKVHVEIVDDSKRTHRQELFNLHERRNKEESGADEPAQ